MRGWPDKVTADVITSATEDRGANILDKLGDAFSVDVDGRLDSISPELSKVGDVVDKGFRADILEVGADIIAKGRRQRRKRDRLLERQDELLVLR